MIGLTSDENTAMASCSLVGQESHTSASKGDTPLPPRKTSKGVLLNSATGLIPISSLLFSDIGSALINQETDQSCLCCSTVTDPEPHKTFGPYQFSCQNEHIQEQERMFFPWSLRGLEVLDQLFRTLTCS